MNPLLLSGFGISISVDRRRLIIYDKMKKERLEFYPHQINHDSIIINGHTGGITFEAIRWLMKHDINLTILNWNGNLIGVTLPKEPKNGKLKVMQYQTYLDGNKRLAIAQEIVTQKIAHYQMKLIWRVLTKVHWKANQMALHLHSQILLIISIPKGACNPSPDEAVLIISDEEKQ